ncbi:hypothetical protein [Kroppenstedtia sanguinis]|mgnify:CR=1 FL=1|uniref:DUF4386 domain-containing protein n=1 Tax=Kroppenstedtia sanguinis TaxID=1380684 RepID=A0ABW4CC30_9BACL
MKRPGWTIKGGIAWSLWLTRGAAVVILSSVILTLLYLVQLDPDSLGKRMLYISDNETAILWSWGMNLLTAVVLIGVFVILTRVLATEYRPILQMALMIWVIGAASWMLHDFIQITFMPELSRMFLALPTESLARYIMDWEHLLTQLFGIFSCSCFAVSGYMYTAVMYRTEQFTSRFAGYSFSVWSFLLISAIVLRWEERLALWLITGALFMMVIWTWLLAGEISRIKRQDADQIAISKA